MNLFAGDYDRLQSLYPDVGAGPVIRTVVRRFIEQCEATAPVIIDNLPNAEI
jgi:hypothetical protein